MERYTDADTGVAYIEVSPGWSTDTTWEVRACVQETLEMEPIRVTTAQQDRSWYFKTIDGKPASVDFEKQVSVWPKQMANRMWIKKQYPQRR